MSKLKPLPITYLPGVDLEEYRHKWRGEDAIDNLIRMLANLDVIKLTKKD